MDEVLIIWEGNWFYKFYRIVSSGIKTPRAYFTKFLPESFYSHPDFQVTASFTMDIIPGGTDDITSESLETLSSISPIDVTTPSPLYSNLTVTYVQGPIYASDVVFQVIDESINVAENISNQVTPAITYSISGTTAISYSVVNYITPAPSWVTINSSTGILNILSPDVTSDTEFDFYINSAVTGITSPVQKLIKLTVLNWISLNWQKWINTSGTIWNIWNSGYYSNSGIWSTSPPLPNPSSNSNQNSSSQNSNTSSNTAQILSTVIKSVVGAIVGCVVLASIMNSSSIASLWMTINQLQIFFLLLLTRAFIPEDVQTIIEGCDFASNIYEYIPFRNLSISSKFLHSFEFNLTNSMLDPLKISYDSSIANTYSIILSFIATILFYIWICLLRLWSKSWRDSQNWIIRFANWLIKKIFIMMTFSYFIRNMLEILQFVLISSINEIYEYDTSSSLRLTSFIYAIALVLLFLTMLLFILYLTLSSYRFKKDEHNMLEEFFRGLNNNKKSKFYVVVLLMRRFIFVLLLITLVSTPSKTLIGILWGIQVFYTGYIILTRPYEEIKGNIINLKNWKDNYKLYIN